MRERTQEHDQAFAQSIEEIAKSEGVSKQAIEKTINGALRKLRYQAKLKGLTFEDLIPVHSRASKGYSRNNHEDEPTHGADGYDMSNVSVN